MKRIAALFLALAAAIAHAQSGSGTRITGSYGGVNGAASISVTFNCTGEPTCSGTFVYTITVPSLCTNTLTFAGNVVITGLNLGQPGTIQGNYSEIANEITGVTLPPSGVGPCAFVLGPNQLTDTTPYTGTWDGRTGRFTLPDTDANGNPISIPVTFTAQRSSIPPPPPVFPLTVTGGIANGVGNVQAAIQFRPQDVGSSGNVYVFALAPANLVKNAQVGALDPPLARALGVSGAKDAPVQCVLAQLSASGQLTGVTASAMQASISGTLSSAGASVSVLNNAPAAPIAGAVMYVGYGGSSTAMINNGVNRSAITVPGPQVCNPQAPEAGWWWNANEPGRGFSIETQGSHLFMAGYLYDPSGRSTWVVSGGLASLDGSLFNGALQTFSGGQTLTGNYQAPAAPGTAGTLTLAFSDATHGTLIWPGGSVPITRFPIAAPLTGTPPAFAPETGWWWGPSESGRGYFMEFLGTTAFIAAYMYDGAGNPLWYLGGGSMTTPQSFQGAWSQYGNGQTLTGIFKPASVVNANVGAVSIQFSSTSNATLTLPNGKTVPITRFAF
jgi:hypothetical protein